MPLTNRIKNQHLLWSAAFGPMAENIAGLDNITPKELWNTLKNNSKDIPTKMNIATNPLTDKAYINEGGAPMKVTEMDALTKKLLAQQYKDDLKNMNLAWLNQMINRKANNVEVSNNYFSKVLAQNPNDYLATLWGKQVAGKITFKLTEFEAAERVWLVGEFSAGLKNPIKMRKENGYWTCDVTLPKGEANYRFVVNNSYYIDFKNVLHVGKNENTLSKIYVW